MNFLTRWLTPGAPTPAQQELAAQKAQASGTPENLGRQVINPERPDALSQATTRAGRTGVVGGFENAEAFAADTANRELELARRQAENLAQQADQFGTDALRAVGRETGANRQLEQMINMQAADAAQGPLRAVGQGATIDLQSLIKQKITPNALDQYANYTYHIKFWMTSDSQAEAVSSSGNKSYIDNIPKVVIAESGVTVGFNIQEFTYRNLVGTTKETRNMPCVSWTMKITEPYGFSLPDRMSSASREIGVLNWQRGKYFIQLYFTGYNENGEPVSGALFHQVFRVSITNINFNGNEGGGNYDISGLFDGMMGYTNQLSLAQKNISVAATTVGKLFEKFEVKLNENANDLALGTAPLEEYKIVFPKEMTNWKINPNSLSDDARSRNMNIKAEGDTVQITANPGVDFSNMVYRVLSLTDEYLRWSQGGEGQPNTFGTLTHGLVKNVKIHSKVEHVGYDAMAKDYVKRITYTIVPYYEVRVRGEDIPTVRAVEKTNVQQDKLRFLLAANKIRKKYEWIYTGQNLDIIKFEFKVNNFFVIATVPFSGLNINSNQTQGPVSNENSSAWQQRQARYRTAKRKYDNLTSELKEAELELAKAKENAATQLGLDQAARVSRFGQPSRSLQGMIGQNLDSAFQASARAEQKVATLRGQQQQAYQNLVASRRDFVDFYSQGSDGIVSNNPLAQQRRSAEANFLSRYQNAVDRGQRDLFVEDQDVLELATEMPFSNTVKPDQEACIADFNQGAASRQVSGNADNKINYPRSRTLFGSVVGNLDSVNKEMMNIELEIRGDPYWLGHSNIEVNLNVPDNLNQLPEDFAEYVGGDNMFYLSFRSGQAPNEDTGLMEFTTNNQFVDGFYSVVEVKNTFSNGRFTQVLKSFKDTFSQYGNNVMDKYVKEAETNKQLRAIGQAATPAVAAPPSVVRTPQPLQYDALGNPTGF